MSAIRQELMFDTPDGLKITSTGHELFPFRLVHEGMAYSTDNFAVDLCTTIDMTREELTELLVLGADALDAQPLVPIVDTGETVTIVLDKQYVRSLANVLGLDVVAPHEKPRGAKVADRIYIDTIQFSTLVEMLGMKLIEGEPA